MTHEEFLKKTNKEILKLKTGECFIYPSRTCGDCGKAEIWRINNTFVLFEIPNYGGNPMYCSVAPIDRIDSLIKTIESWT